MFKVKTNGWYYISIPQYIHFIEIPSFKLSFITELYELPCDEEWEIDRSQITLREQLGEGAFGLVMRADAVGLPDLPSTCSVAVKMLKGKSVLINPFYWKRRMNNTL